MQISAGYDLGCGLTCQGEIRCWGELQDPPEAFQQIGFSAVDAGYEQACGILATGSVHFWA